MMVVRYPDGTAVTYNNANFLRYNASAWSLYTKEDGDWIASVQLSAGATVEAVPACKVERPEDQIPLERLLEHVLDRLRDHKRRHTCVYWPLLEPVRHLKCLLGRCDMRGGRWQ